MIHMGLISFFLSLVIPINSSLNCYVDLQRTIDDTYSDSTCYISSLGNLVQNNPSVISSTASITVFTPGMGGDGKDWYSIDNQNGAPEEFGGLGLNPFVDPQTIYLRNKVDYFNPLDGETPEITLTSLYVPSFSQNGSIDFSKPLFLIYQGLDDASTIERYKSNYTLYWHFAQALDAFLYSYYEAFGTVPKVNLIGHSRGGLVNMIYAINHPSLVASFMSVGTPYLGSDWAEVLYDFDEAIIAANPNATVDHTPYYGVVGEAFANEYAAAWNDVVQEYSFPTKVVGCGYSQSLLSEIVGDTLDSVWNDWVDSFSSAGLGFFSGLASNVVTNVVSFLVTLLTQGAAAFAELFVGEALNRAALAARLIGFFTQNQASGFIADAFDQIAEVLDQDVVSPLMLSLPVTTDFAVNLNSQVGETRNGTPVFDFDTEELIFDYDDFLASESSRPDAPPVLHNYEAKSPLVKAQFASLLQANPSCTHTHSFSVSNSGNSHTFSCGCGATFHSHQGSYGHSYYSQAKHLKTCLLCGYSRLMDHSISYTGYSASGHSGYCLECPGLVNNAPHEFVYSGSSNSHVGMCPCGYSVIEPHVYVGGRCLKCGRRKPGGGF